MATVVYSSFIDPPQQTDVPPAMTVRLKLAPAKPADFPCWGSPRHSIASNNIIPHQDQAEATVALARKDDFAPAPVRQPPPVKLSDMSLRLCTEDLGNETGSDDISGFDSAFFNNLSNSENPVKSPTSPTRQHSGGKKVIIARPIPPPLTTLRGAETLQVSAHREEGRLIINAVKSPRKSACFLAERAHGRLRLSLEVPAETHYVPFDQDGLTEPEEDEQTHLPSIVSDGSIDKVGIIRDDTELMAHSCVNLFADEEYRENGDIPMFIPAIRARCNEGEHDHHHHHQIMMSLNWEPLWVATS